IPTLGGAWRGKEFSVRGTERDTTGLVPRLAEGADLLPGGRVPKPHVGIPAARRGQAAAVRAERDTKYGPAGTGESLPFLTGPPVPDLRGLIQAGRDQVPAIRAERDTGDIAAVSPQGEGGGVGLALQRGGVPDPHGHVVARRNELLAVGAER